MRFEYLSVSQQCIKIAISAYPSEGPHGWNSFSTVHTFTLTSSHSPSIPKHTPSYLQTLLYTRMYAHRLTYIHTVIHIHSQTLSYTPSHSHTKTHTHAHVCTLTFSSLTHTYTYPHCRSWQKAQRGLLFPPGHTAQLCTPVLRLLLQLIM